MQRVSRSQRAKTWQPLRSGQFGKFLLTLYGTMLSRGKVHFRHKKVMGRYLSTICFNNRSARQKFWNELRALTENKLYSANRRRPYSRHSLAKTSKKVRVVQS
jgi:hypothetical protein